VHVQEKEACAAGEHGSIYENKAHCPLFLRTGDKGSFEPCAAFFFFFLTILSPSSFSLLFFLRLQIHCSLSQEQVTLCILLVMGQIWLEERTAAEKSNQNANGGGDGRGRDRR
jgi:hypothetical protein